MKSGKTKVETPAAAPKGKAKLKNLKLRKETLQSLSDQDAGAVRGGASGTSHSTVRTWSCDGG
jgi:hypothetical protein